MAEDDARGLRRRGLSPIKSINKGARGLLGQTMLSELVLPKRVLVLSSNMTVGQALERLAKHKVLSAPLLRIPEEGPHVEYSDEWPEDRPYPDILGFVGVRDILETCMSEIQEALANKSKSQQDMLKTMAHLKLIAPEIECRKIEKIEGADGDFLFQNLARCSLLDVLVKAFLVPRRASAFYSNKDSATGELKDSAIVHAPVHRLGIFDARARVTGVVSQSDVLHFLLQHAKELGSIVDHTVEELGLGMPKPVVCVDSTAPALEAFEKMYKNNLSAVGVLSPETRIIIGNLSMSDLRCLSFENLGYLVLPVSEFLVLLSSSRGEDRQIPHQTQHKPALLTVAPTSKFIEVLKLFAENRIHRVYVVDGESGVLVGVITPTDVIQAVTTTVYQMGEHPGDVMASP